MFAIYKKELKNYFINMTGYIFIGFMLAITGIFTTLVNLIGTYPSFENVLSNITIVFLLIIPILTMRSVAEERHSKTDQLLYSLPVSVTQIVLAKYLAMFTVFLIPVAIIGLYPLILSIFGLGINFGIDFAGGLSMKYAMGGEYVKADVEGILNGLNLGGYSIAEQGGNEINIRINTLAEDEVQTVQASLEEALFAK
jgi:ABC-type transport system involved in multi-copper enzyme maturation permease subunit